jgi:phage gp46-like protein
MPTDIALTWNTEAQGCRAAFAANDLVTSKSLLTAVLISLFTDARAADDDPLPDPRNDDRRGWWGDATNTAAPTDSVGSKLWLLEREKNIVDAVKRGKTYVQEALVWMVDEGVAKSVVVTVESQAVGNSGTIMLAFKIDITKPDGVNETFKFEQEWRATADGI